jgi:hypothetical protein
LPDGLFDVGGPRAVLVDENAGELLGPLRGLGISFSGGDDRAFHQDVPAGGKLLGIGQLGFAGTAGDDRADVSQVLRAGPAERMGGTHLDQHVDERAALEICLRLLKPFVKDIEDGQHVTLGIGCAPRGLGFDKVDGPQLFAALQEGQYKIVLGRKCLYSVALATPQAATTSSTPTARTPRRANRS